MSLDPRQVSAVIVTKGGEDLTEILDSLIFDDVVVLDNSKEPVDLMTYGILAGIARARHDRIYSQDDDIVHSPENQRAILAAYEPGYLTGCMWPEWSDGAKAQGIQRGYDDLVFYGSGAIYDRAIPRLATAKYLDRYPFDDFFLLWASCIIGILAPSRQIDVRFDSLPNAVDGTRMCDLPDAVSLKREAIMRAREIRDWKPDAHAFQLAEAAAGRYAEHRYL